jgi:Fur family transcriptional regulator, ferric uptake regulator
MSTAARKRTRQGEAVLRAVQASDGFRSAQEIHAQMRATGEAVGLTTVYRHLQLLADDHVIDALHLDDGQVAYRFCSTDHHHHHVVCRQCGMSVEIDCPDIGDWAQRAAKRVGFAAPTHRVEVFGTCPACQNVA